MRSASWMIVTQQDTIHVSSMKTLTAIITHVVVAFGLVFSAFIGNVLAQTGGDMHAAHGQSNWMASGERSLGVVAMPVTCSEQAKTHFDTGLLLMHHMMYEQAREAFLEAGSADGACAMARWGAALTYVHPLWPGQPSAAETAAATALIAEARSIGLTGNLTRLESDLIEAAAVLFKSADEVSYTERIAHWEAAQHGVLQRHPASVEAGAFYALAHLATAPKSDKTFSHQRRAGAILESLLENAPGHPGLFHYTIHAYDNPVLAERAVRVARGYDKLAPDVPHALHMPTHVFVRLGLWDDVIAWNKRSAQAAFAQPVGDQTSMHYVHALDYLMYAYLQQRQYEAAAQVLAKVNSVDRYQNTAASAYGIAAAQARYALEQDRWEEAARLRVRTHETFEWDHFPWFEAITYFARGIGSARAGDAGSALAAANVLDELYGKAVESGETYWATHVDAQRTAVRAWATFASGDREVAALMMRRAAELEDSVDKHPVTPGAVLPARELLGDMLEQMGQPHDALQAYEQALTISPNRFRSLAGAARSARRAGDRDAAGLYDRMITELRRNTTGGSTD